MTSVINPSTPFEMFLPIALIFLIAVAPTVGVEMWRTPHARKLERLRHSLGAILLFLCVLHIIFMLISPLHQDGGEMWDSLLILSGFLAAGLLLWRKGEVGMGLKWFIGLGLLWFIFTVGGLFYIGSITSIEPELTIYLVSQIVLGIFIVLVCPLLAYKYPVQFTDEEE